MSKNMNLDDMMEGKPRNAPISFDVTKGKPTSVPSNEARVNPLSAMQPTGDLENVQPVDISKIARKKPTPDANSEAANPIMSNLQKAVTREKESITKRIQELEEVQRQEFEEEMEKKTEAYLDEDADYEDNDDTSLSEILTTEADEEDTEEAEDDLDGIYTPVEDYIIHDMPHVKATDDVEVEKPYEITGEAPTGKVYVGAPDPEKVLVTEEDKPVELHPNVHEVDYNQESESEEETVEEDIRSVDEDIDIVDGISNDDLFDDEEITEGDTEEEEEERANKIIDSIKTELKEKSTKIKASLDLSKFTVAKKSANAQKIMKIAVQNNRKVADWVLYAEGRPFSVSGLSGAEIVKMNPENSTRNRLNTLRDIYRIIYEHLEDANKPEFETWCKQVKYVDLPHLYFALYMATFSDSNFLTYTCPKCKKVFIQDVEFKNMIEYADDETKDKVAEMLRLDTTSPKKHEYDIELVQVSDKFAFGIRTPSLYNVVMETASVSDKFLSAYSDLMDTIAYIDTIYYIDMEHQELVPVDTKPVPTDIAKTSARKIKIFHNVINNLSSSDFYTLRAKIAEHSSKTTDKITYKIPECTCPDCGEKIEEQKPVGPDYLLFTRHQLEAIGSL